MFDFLSSDHVLSNGAVPTEIGRNAGYHGHPKGGMGVTFTRSEW